MERLEAALHMAFAFDLVDRDSGVKAFERPCAERFEFEEIAQETPRGLRDQHAAAWRKFLQPGRQVRRLTHDRFLPREPLADEIAHHDEPRRDANVELDADLPFEPRNGRHQIEAGLHRPFDVVLVRLRIAKVGHNAVAQVLGYESFVFADDIGATFLR